MISVPEIIPFVAVGNARTSADQCVPFHLSRLFLHFPAAKKLETLTDLVVLWHWNPKICAAKR